MAQSWSYVSLPVVVGLIVRINRRRLIIAIADQFAMADVLGPGRRAVFERDIIDSGKRFRERVGVRNGRPFTVETVRRPGAIVPRRADRFDQSEVSAGALDFVSHAAFKHLIARALNRNFRIAHAVRKIRELRPTAIHVAVIARGKQVSVGVVADHPEINPKPG